MCTVLWIYKGIKCSIFTAVCFADKTLQCIVVQLHGFTQDRKEKRFIYVYDCFYVSVFCKSMQIKGMRIMFRV